MASENSTVQFLAVLLLVGCPVLFFGLGGYELRDSTEPRVAGTAAGMLVGGDWVVPKLNGHAFLEKPPLCPWLGALSMGTFGLTPLAARLPSALAGLMVALGIFWALIRLRQPPARALLAASLLVTTAGFWDNARQAGEDTVLTLGVTLCLLSFFQATGKKWNFGAWWLFAAGLAIATMSKGVLGLAIPGVTIFAFLSAETVVSKRWVPADWLRPVGAGLVGLIPLCVWIGLLYHRSGGQAVSEVLWANSFGRFSGEFARGGHLEPFYYYLTKIPELFQPWAILVYLGLWRCLRAGFRDRWGIFLSCWILAPFALLSLSSGKRMVYLLSIYPAAAMMAGHYAGCLYERWREEKVRPAALKRLSWLYALAATGGVIGVMLYAVSRGSAPVGTALLGLALATAGLLLWRSLWRRHLVGLTASGITIVALSYLGYAGIVLPPQDASESYRPLFRRCLELKRDGYGLALFQPSERLAGAAVFYLADTVPALASTDQLDAFLGSPAKKAVVVLEGKSASGMGSRKRIDQFTVGKRLYYLVSE
jgi:4-amino-4-deoxy-L-arabinose transferase-like glycosyltransferase